MSMIEHEEERWTNRTGASFGSTSKASGPSAALRRHWLPALAATVAGALVGALVGWALPVTYTAESRVGVGMGDLSSGAIAGFPLAAEELASNYARYVNDTGVTTGSVPEGVELAASNIPESNVLRIEAESTDEQLALSVARDTADTLITTVNDSDGQRSAEATYEQYRQAQDDLRTTTAVFNTYDAEVARLEALATPREQLEGVRAELNSAITNREMAQVRVDGLRALYVRQVSEDSEAADLVLVRAASVVNSSRAGSVQRGALVGLVLGALVGLGLATAAARRRSAAPAVTSDPIATTTDDPVTLEKDRG